MEKDDERENGCSGRRRVAGCVESVWGKDLGGWKGKYVVE